MVRSSAGFGKRVERRKREKTVSEAKIVCVWSPSPKEKVQQRQVSEVVPACPLENLLTRLGQTRRHSNTYICMIFYQLYVIFECFGHFDCSISHGEVELNEN